MGASFFGQRELKDSVGMNSEGKENSAPNPIYSVGNANTHIQSSTLRKRPGKRKRQTKQTNTAQKLNTVAGTTVHQNGGGEQKKTGH